MPRLGLLTMCLLALTLPATAEVTCVDCHNGITPGLVADWSTSRHSEVGVDCAVCHGEEHTKAENAALA